MEFKDFEIEGCKFSILARPTVRQQLAFDGKTLFCSDEDKFTAHWEADQKLIVKWECDALPDYRVSIDDISNPSQKSVIELAVLQIAAYMRGLQDIPKN